MWYREAGEGLVALFVHGFPLDSRMWLDQIHRLADRRRCVAPDLRGFGNSGATTQPALSMDTHADDLAGLCDELGAEQVDLVGRSMGGYVSLAFAQRHPDRLRTLALVDTRAIADPAEGRAGRDAMAAELLERGRAWLAERMLEVLVAPGAAPSVRARLRTMIEDQPYETIVAALAGMRDRPDRTGVLADLERPVAVIVGEHDVLTPPEQARAMADAAAEATYTVIPAAGHMSPMEAPDAVAAALWDLWALAEG